MELAEKQDPQYREIATNALNRWTETGSVSQKMATWIRRSAKFKGMRMPDELQELISERLDCDGVEQDVEPPQHRFSEEIFFDEIGRAFAKIAERLHRMRGAGDREV